MKLPTFDTQVATWRAMRAASPSVEAAQAAVAEERGEGGVDRARAGLQRAATQFESLFYGQLLRAMRSTVPDNGFWGQSSGAKIYRQLHDEQLATKLGEQGGLGIADLIVDQFASAVSREEGTREAPTPLPGSRRRGLAAYRSQQIVVPEAADLARLRHLAAGEGGAVADTLGRFQHELVAASRDAGVDPALVLAVTMRESGGDPAAVSHRGARGLMQLMPATAAELGVHDPDDPGQNLRGGARYLAQMLARYDDDVDLALAAYNAGPGTVDRAGRQVPNYPETQHYVAAVRDLATRLGATPGTNLDKGNARDDRPNPRTR